MRWPALAAATTSAWCFISSCAPGTARLVGSGSSMQDETPPEASSKARKRGPSSSQLASAPAPTRRGADSEKSGARKGLASFRDITDWGTTRRSPSAARARSGPSLLTSGSGAKPAAACI